MSSMLQRVCFRLLSCLLFYTPLPGVQLFRSRFFPCVPYSSLSSSSLSIPFPFPPRLLSPSPFHSSPPLSLSHPVPSPSPGRSSALP